MRAAQRWAVAALGLTITALPIAIAAPAQAAENIAAFAVQVEINADTTLDLTETFAWDFDGNYKHGVFRAIPIYSELPDGYRQYYDINVISVTQDGKPAQASQSVEGAYLVVKIGNPNATITGTHVYSIDYTVGGALTTIAASDTNLPSGVSAGDAELYWNFIGTQWDVYIRSAKATISGPAAPLGTRCYTGMSGSTNSCTITSNGNSVTLGPELLSPTEALTGVIAYSPKAFTAPITPDIRKGPGAQALSIAAITIPIALLLGAIPVVIAISTRRRNKGVDIAYAPVRYGPPDDLRPAEISAAWAGEVDGRALTATVLDLTARKHVTVAQQGHDQLLITWRGEATDLRPWENALLAAILKGQPQATLGHYDPEVAEAVTATKIQLINDALTSGRRNPDGDRPDRPWKSLLAIGGLLSVIVVVISIWGGVPVLAAAVLPFTAMAAISGGIAAWITPRMQTRTSATFLSEVEGFRRLLDTDAAAARREFVQKLGLTDVAVFATMLPYAVVFGLSESWVGAFPDLTPEQLHGVGYNVAGTYLLWSMVNTSTMALTSSTTAPQRSGDSGFSGGFSGGGGGGGGGGSW
jgi:uncharacterized membrane protein YgcG